METLDPHSEADVKAAWSDEIKRRLAEIDEDRVELFPWEGVRAELSLSRMRLRLQLSERWKESLEIFLRSLRQSFCDILLFYFL